GRRQVCSRLHQHKMPHHEPLLILLRRRGLRHDRFGRWRWRCFTLAPGLRLSPLDRAIALPWLSRTGCTLCRKGLRRSLLESIAGIAVVAARSPLPAALFNRRLRRALRCLCRFRRLPQPPAREPFHHDVAVLSLQLMERRQKLFTLPRAKG